MSSALLFFLGLAAVVATWVWLGRSNARDSEQLAQALDMSVESRQVTEERSHGAGRTYARRVMHGDLGGQSVEIWSRSFWPHRLSRSSRHETVVRMPLRRPSPQRLLMQPRVLAALMDWGYGAPGLAEVRLGDAELDAYFQVRCDDVAWARRVFGPDARAELHALQQMLVPARQEIADYLTDAAMLGALRIEPGYVELALRGTPRPALAHAIRAAVELLNKLAARAGGP